MLSKVGQILLASNKWGWFTEKINEDVKSSEGKVFKHIFPPLNHHFEISITYESFETRLFLIKNWYFIYRYNAGNIFPKSKYTCSVLLTKLAKKTFLLLSKIFFKIIVKHTIHRLKNTTTDRLVSPVDKLSQNEKLNKSTKYLMLD